MLSFLERGQWDCPGRAHDRPPGALKSPEARQTLFVFATSSVGFKTRLRTCNMCCQTSMSEWHPLKLCSLVNERNQRNCTDIPTHPGVPNSSLMILSVYILLVYNVFFEFGEHLAVRSAKWRFAIRFNRFSSSAAANASIIG